LLFPVTYRFFNCGLIESGDLAPNLTLTALFDRSGNIPATLTPAIPTQDQPVIPTTELPTTTPSEVPTTAPTPFPDKHCRSAHAGGQAARRHPDESGIP